MQLSHALGGLAAGDIDPGRPITLGPYELGPDAAEEAIRLLEAGDFPAPVLLKPSPAALPVYWSVSHETEGEAEIFSLPAQPTALPTAIEIGIVRAIAGSSVEEHASILGGDVQVAIGSEAAHRDFRRIIEAIQPPLIGSSILYGSATQVSVSRDVSILFTTICEKCLSNAFRTSPLKFRFLEIYRIMEARFLADIKLRLISNFDSGPGEALSEASNALKSEMNQIVGLASAQKQKFEECWLALHQIKNTNRFTAALFRRVAQKAANGGDKWETGAALIYQIRCAVVHAGAKDMIFENFPDGDAALEAVLPCLERTALALIGIEVL